MRDISIQRNMSSKSWSPTFGLAPLTSVPSGLRIECLAITGVLVIMKIATPRCAKVAEIG
jgi:hypothetical protein